MLHQPDGISTIRAYLALGTRLYRRVGELLGNPHDRRTRRGR